MCDTKREQCTGDFSFLNPTLLVFLVSPVVPFQTTIEILLLHLWTQLAFSSWIGTRFAKGYILRWKLEIPLKVLESTDKKKQFEKRISKFLLAKACGSSPLIAITSTILLYKLGRGIGVARIFFGGGHFLKISYENCENALL